MFTEGRADIKAERGSLSLSGFLECLFHFICFRGEDELSTLRAADGAFGLLKLCVGAVCAQPPVSLCTFCVFSRIC